MRVLGIDPGTRVVGYGVVEPQGYRIVPVAFGVIRPKGAGIMPSGCAGSTKGSSAC